MQVVEAQHLALAPANDRLEVGVVLMDVHIDSLLVLFPRPLLATTANDFELASL